MNAILNQAARGCRRAGTQMEVGDPPGRRRRDDPGDAPILGGSKAPGLDPGHGRFPQLARDGTRNADLVMAILPAKVTGRSSPPTPELLKPVAPDPLVDDFTAEFDQDRAGTSRADPGR